MSDINRFTEKAQEALAAAQRLATRAGNPQVDVEHLLASLLEDEQGLAGAILRKAGVDVAGLTRRVQEEINGCRASRAAAKAHMSPADC